MSGRAARLSVIAPGGVPEVRPGDDLGEIVLEALAAEGEAPTDGDVLVLAQKIVSKAEGRYADLGAVTPSAEALDLAGKTHKDARLVELILGESQEVLRHRPGVLVVVHKRGYVMANAGIDASNIEPVHGVDTVLLLPEDADKSAARLRGNLRARAGVEVGVIVNDSLGRAWRNGTSGVALGAAGIAALLDLRGRADRFGRDLRITEVGLADELAATASVVMGQADEGRPVVLIRGLPYPAADGAAADLIRDRELDLFR